MTSLLPVTCLTVQSTVSILSLMQRCAVVVPELSAPCMAELCSVCFSYNIFFLDLSH